MSAPVRIQLSRAKGWRMPANTIKVDRSTRWGNPFVCNDACAPLTPAQAVTLYRRQISALGGFWPPVTGRFIGSPFVPEVQIRAALRGMNLACWCKPGSPCHADVLLELANAPLPSGEKRS